MDSKDFIAGLRKTDDSPEVARLLAALGVKKKLKLPKDDDEVRVDLPKLGLTLVFEPEGPKTSKLAFVEVQFLSSAEKGITSFGGELPGKLLFSDTRTEAAKKLGKPAESKKEFRLDRWKLEGLVLTVTYSKDDGRITTIQVGTPLKD